MILLSLILFSLGFIYYLDQFPRWLQKLGNELPPVTIPKSDRYLHILIYLFISAGCQFTTTLWWHTYLYYFLLGFCYAIAYLDYRYRLISVLHCYILITLAFFFLLLQITTLTIEQALISFIFAFISSITGYFICFFLFGEEKLGLGDILLFSALALFILPTWLPWLLLIASSITLSYALLIKKKNPALPFAPGLILATLILYLLQ
ncbi:prepilin peptidase [Gallibacterium trehalosifermentans]|uniref:Prepilin peptidase n=1 Tax=Gallibacterium trehalosifermentans TaxID=516935 RepID=A0ABV6H176_9PAST